MRRWHKQRRGDHVLRRREELQGVWDPSGGNRSGDGRWLPDPRVPPWLTGREEEEEEEEEKPPSLCNPAVYRMRLYSQPCCHGWLDCGRGWERAQLLHS